MIVLYSGDIYSVDFFQLQDLITHIANDRKLSLNRYAVMRYAYSAFSSRCCSNDSLDECQTLLGISLIYDHSRDEPERERLLRIYDCSR